MKLLQFLVGLIVGWIAVCFVLLILGVFSLQHTDLTPAPEWVQIQQQHQSETAALEWEETERQREWARDGPPQPTETFQP